jgi:hypothetical protein
MRAANLSTYQEEGEIRAYLGNSRVNVCVQTL